jgi:sporulation protein YlmC with PRC-barrel domain
MNKIGTFTATASIISLLLAPATFAGQERDTGEETGMPQTHQQAPAAPAQKDQGTLTPSAPPAMKAQPMEGKAAQHLKASQVIGFNVKNRQGEELGQIGELVVDPQDGRIAYAVLSVGGFLGMGDKLFAIPWEALTPMAEQPTFTLDVDKEKLAKAPGFDESTWPDMANREWGTSVHKYYDQKPYWE